MIGTSSSLLDGAVRVAGCGGVHEMGREMDSLVESREGVFRLDLCVDQCGEVFTKATVRLRCFCDSCSACVAPLDGTVGLCFHLCSSK